MMERRKAIIIDAHSLDADKKRQFLNEDRQLQITSANNGLKMIVI
jgi:hypothetical protein